MDTFGKEIYSAQLIPNRGAWIELETDANGIISVRIDRNRKMPVTYLIRALGFSSNEEIMELFNNDIHIEETLKKDETQNTKKHSSLFIKSSVPANRRQKKAARPCSATSFMIPAVMIWRRSDVTS